MINCGGGVRPNSTSVEEQKALIGNKIIDLNNWAYAMTAHKDHLTSNGYCNEFCNAAKNYTIAASELEKIEKNVVRGEVRIPKTAIPPVLGYILYFNDVIILPMENKENQQVNRVSFDVFPINCDCNDVTLVYIVKY